MSYSVLLYYIIVYHWRLRGLSNYYNWAYKPTYNVPNWPYGGYPTYKSGYKPSYKELLSPPSIQVGVRRVHELPFCEPWSKLLTSQYAGAIWDPCFRAAGLYVMTKIRIRAEGPYTG